MAPRTVGLAACAALVVANMVGTGIFTSLGFQVGDIPSRPAILILWSLGGVLALCGALCYAELSAALPRSGGEYHFLGQIYHPSLGFMAGIVAIVIGFASPVALSAMAFGSYLQGVFPEVPALAASIAVVVLVTLFHLRDLRLSSIFQIFFHRDENHAYSLSHRGIFQRARLDSFPRGTVERLHADRAFRRLAHVHALRVFRMECSNLHFG